MARADKTLIFVLLFLVVVVCGGIALQIFLSKRRGKLPGLILPAVSFLLSVLGFLGTALFTVSTTVSQATSEGGEAVGEAVVTTAQSSSLYPAIMTGLVLFLLYNIPTVILLAIYAACRERIINNKEINNMNIQDLE